jgi:hypothetical protein
MATVKTFDNADLIRFFAETADVGHLTVITPSRTLFNETDTTRYPIEAKTEALWCEKYGLAFVVQSVNFPDGGRSHLAKDHPLRQDPTVHVRSGNGGGSAFLMRWSMELADNWCAAVKWWLPTEHIDLTKRRPERIEPDAPIDQDHTPTGTSIDDPFEDGEAQA